MLTNFIQPLLTSAFLTAIQMAGGQDIGRASEAAILDTDTRTVVVEDINKLLVDYYIFPDVAQNLAERLSRRLANGEYDSLNDPATFAGTLTKDLRQASQDKHFYIEYNPDEAMRIKTAESGSREERTEAERQEQEKYRLVNYGFTKLERLPGNVGLLELNLFCNPEYAGETAVAAMSFLANCDAVIIDLRNNHGGFPTMVQLLCSYFVEGEKEGRTHLNSFERRYDHSQEQFWTLAYIPGRRIYDKDLYVVTSEQTASAAEEFTYDMKNLKRATIVGEKTSGAAHHVDHMLIQKNFILNIPTGRPINPISKANWEGIGIEPCIAFPVAQALDRAHLMALEKLLPKADENQRFTLDWAINGLKARLVPVNVEKSILKAYTGDYGERKIRLIKGALYYQRTGPRYRLIPLSRTLFAVEGLDYFRLQFVYGDGGKTIKVIGLYEQGLQDPSFRTR